MKAMLRMQYFSVWERLSLQKKCKSFGNIVFSHNFSAHFLRMIVCMKNQITSKIILLKYIEIHSMALGCESAHAPAAAGGLAEKATVSLGGRSGGCNLYRALRSAVCVCVWVGGFASLHLHLSRWLLLQLASRAFRWDRQFSLGFSDEWIQCSSISCLFVSFIDNKTKRKQCVLSKRKTDICFLFSLSQTSVRALWLKIK